MNLKKSVLPFCPSFANINNKGTNKGLSYLLYSLFSGFHSALPFPPRRTSNYTTKKALFKSSLVRPVLTHEAEMVTVALWIPFCY